MDEYRQKTLNRCIDGLSKSIVAVTQIVLLALPKSRLSLLLTASSNFTSPLPYCDNMHCSGMRGMMSVMNQS